MGTKDEKKVLIVDDAVINREILKRIFSKEYSVITASNGKEAIEIVKKEKS